MKVCYLLGSNKGGLPHYTASLANAVSESQEVSIIKPSEVPNSIFNDDIEIFECLKPTEISITNLYNFKLNPIKNLKGITSYDNIKIIDQIDPDLVHIPTGLFPHVQFYYWKNSLGEKYPTFVTMHEVTPKVPSKEEWVRYPIMVKKVLNYITPNINISHYIVHTDKNKNTLINKGVNKKSVSVIPHGSYSFFKDYDYDKKSEEEGTILFFGNIVPHKALDKLVQATARAKDEIPDITLIIAGEGRIKNKSKKIINKHPTTFEVHNKFIPNKKVGELFSRAQITILPYKKQGGNKGHSGVLMTSYAFGTPVIASKAGDFENLVDDTGGGITIELTPTKLKNAIVHLLTHDEERLKKSKSALEVSKELSWEKIAEKHIKKYRKSI